MHLAKGVTYASNMHMNMIFDFNFQTVNLLSMTVVHTAQFTLTVLKRLLHAKKHCAKTTLYLGGMIMLRKRTLKLDITILYGVIWENLTIAQYVN